MPPVLETALRENVYPVQCKKNDIIQEYGTITDNLYFIEKGLFRYFMPRGKTRVNPSIHDRRSVPAYAKSDF